MDLPQELFDEVFTYVPPDDRRSLRSCTLVAKSWVHPAQRRLFETANVSGRCLEWWLKEISPTNARMLLQRVCSMTYCIDDTIVSPHRPVDLFHDYSSSLCRLKRLTFDSGLPSSLAWIEKFTAFQHTLSYLCLRSLGVTANVVVTLVNYFPNLAHLHLRSLSHKVDGRPIPHFSRPLRELTIYGFTTDGLPLLDQLMGLHPQCNKSTIGVLQLPCPSLTQYIINGVESSIKHLVLESRLGEVGVPLTLSNCGELRELEIDAWRPGYFELDLISSITSRKIEKITFAELTYQAAPHAVSPETWTELDNSLCQIVDRLECGLRLELDLRAFRRKTWWCREQGFRKCLPRSYEKGAILGTPVGEDYDSDW